MYHGRAVSPTKISIHALREEGDHLSCAGASGRIDFYPRPPRGGRPRHPGQLFLERPISIHALREEGDHGARPDHRRRPISIHALREEGDAAEAAAAKAEEEFLSTPSARRATRLRARKEREQ